MVPARASRAVRSLCGTEQAESMYRENHRASLHQRAKSLADRRGGKGSRRIRDAAIAAKSNWHHSV
jgi:hypothetical protein